VFCRKRGIDAELARLFFRLKSSPMVIYPMETQLRLLLDANVAGEHRVFGLESLVPAPLFVRLAGGVDMRDSPSGDLTGPVVRRQAYVITRAGRTWVLGMCAV
jgi:hypothetical protein